MAKIDFSKFKPFKPTGTRFQNLTGQKLGKLTVISFFGQNHFGKMLWLCKCECGEFKVIKANSLQQGNGLSCATRGSRSENYDSPEYQAYIRAKGRCTNTKNQDYKDYGGRGIEFRFCSFHHFLRVIGRRPTTTHSVDRIDVNGHYEKGNVHWATPIEQARNKRNNRLVTAFGETKPLMEWAKTRNIHKTTLTSRLNTGWCAPCAISMAPKSGMCPHIK